MKTRKYFCFVCILIIFTVVFSGCRSGTREDGEDDEELWFSEPGFCQSDVYIGYRTIYDKDGQLQGDQTMRMIIMGTFDEITWRGIELRFRKALEKFREKNWDPDAGKWVGPIISDDILWETFSYEVEGYIGEGSYSYLMSSPYRGAIVVENSHNIGYEWYKERMGIFNLYELSGYDERYDVPDYFTGEDGKEHQRFWNNFDTILFINYDKINRLLEPIDDTYGSQKPALEVAILALNKLVKARK